MENEFVITYHKFNEIEYSSIDQRKRQFINETNELEELGENQLIRKAYSVGYGFKE